jgi:hypothetical protein
MEEQCEIETYEVYVMRMSRVVIYVKTQQRHKLNGNNSKDRKRKRLSVGSFA